MGYQAKVIVHAVGSGEHTKGWVHTHGMVDYSLPELEMRQIPGFLVPDAYRLLRAICDYMLESEKAILPGHTMSIGQASLQFVTPLPIPGSEEHYEYPCLQIVDVPGVRDCCGGDQ